MNQKEQKTNPYTTLLVIVTGLVGLYLFTQNPYLLYTALGIGVVGILSKTMSRWIDFLWMKLADVLGFIMPNILLSLIFCFILFPMALLSRIFSRKDPLFLYKKHQSTFILREKTFEKADLEKMW